MEAVRNAFAPKVEVLLVWNQSAKRWDIMVSDETQANARSMRLVLFDLAVAGVPTAEGLSPVVDEVVKVMKSVICGSVPAEPAGQPVVWDGDQRNAWLAPLKWLRLKPYTFHECLIAAASTRAHPERWGPLAQMLHMRAGRGDMDVEQALATVGLSTTMRVLAELQTLDDSVERLTKLGPHTGVLLPGLAPHEQRVVQEHHEMSERGRKLGAFICGPMFDGLDEADRMLLLRQRKAMAEYTGVLAERIQRFKPAVAGPEGGKV